MILNIYNNDSQWKINHIYVNIPINWPIMIFLRPLKKSYFFKELAHYDF